MNKDVLYITKVITKRVSGTILLSLLTVVYTIGGNTMVNKMHNLLKRIIDIEEEA